MRGLVLAPQPFFTPRGTPFSVYHRAKVMAEQGVRLDLLTYGEGEDVEIPGVRLVRIPQPSPLRPVAVGPSAKKAVLDLVMTAWAIPLLARGRYDFVHAHEEAAFVGLALRPFFRFRFVYDMHSSLPQQLSNFGFTRSRSLVALFRRLEHAVLDRADAVITISPALAEHARSIMPDPGRHFLIENSVLDDVVFSPSRDASSGNPPPVGSGEEGVLPPAVPDGRSLVVYAGTFESYQGLDLLLSAFGSVVSRVPDAFLVLVGGDERQVGEYRRRASELGLERACLIHPRVPQPVARRLVARADVVVSPRSEGMNTPLKIYELLASGVPLVATRILAHTQVLSEECCFMAEPEPEALAEGILRALTNQDARRRKTAAATRLYTERYSREAYLRKIRDLLDLIGRDAR